jgi:hypothetical protein
LGLIRLYFPSQQGIAPKRHLSPKNNTNMFINGLCNTIMLFFSEKEFSLEYCYQYKYN